MDETKSTETAEPATGACETVVRLKLVLGCRYEEDEPSDIVEEVLDMGVFQDALVEYAEDHGRTLTVESCVVEEGEEEEEGAAAATTTSTLDGTPPWLTLALAQIGFAPGDRAALAERILECLPMPAVAEVIADVVRSTCDPNTRPVVHVDMISAEIARDASTRIMQLLADPTSNAVSDREAYLEVSALLDRLGVPRASPTGGPLRPWTLVERVKWLGRQADRTRPLRPQPAAMISENTTLGELETLRQYIGATAITTAWSPGATAEARIVATIVIDDHERFEGAGATVAAAINAALARLAPACSVAP